MTNAASTTLMSLQEYAEDEHATLRGLLTHETPEDYSAIFLLFQAFVFMTLTFGLILFAPALYSIPLCFLASGYMAFAESKRKIYSPITLSLVFLYPLLYVLLLTESPYAAYFGMGVFAWLAIVGLALLLIKKPLTTLYSRGKGDTRLHYIISSIWTASWALSFLSAYLLMPDTLYIVTPFCITFVTFCLVIYLTFFDKWLITKRQKEFVLGEYTFKQLSYPSKEFEDYIDFYAWHISHEVHKKPEGYQTLRDAAHRVDAFEATGKIPFGAYHNGKLVGTCAITLPVKGELLPVEQETPISFDDIRKLGPIADVGRLVIAKGYRERPDVIRGLIKATLEVALERDMVFLMSEVFPSGSMFHFRIGFTTLFKRSHPHFTVTFDPVGTVVVFFNNLASTIFIQSEKINSVTQLGNTVSELLAERWIKRLVVKHAYAKIENLPWMHTIDSIRYLIDRATARAGRSS